MRWGILANLAVILVVSGALLFVVFGASLERAMIDDAVDQAALMADLMESQIRRSQSEEEMWQTVRRLCRPRAGLRPVLYDAKGTFLGGCQIEADLEKPDTQTPGRLLRIEGGGFPMSLLKSSLVVVDVTGQFPHGVKTIRGVLEVPRSGFSPAWKFFAAYLVLTQASLFFLGYLLFHRTVIGPIRDVARLAGRASGLTDLQNLSDSGRFKEDIQQISASLRAMIIRIVEDRSSNSRGRIRIWPRLKRDSCARKRWPRPEDSRRDLLTRSGIRCRYSWAMWSCSSERRSMSQPRRSSAGWIRN